MIKIELPVFLMAAISSYVGLYHLAFFLRRTADKTNLAFAFLSLAVAYYQISCAGLYTANNIEQGIFWQHFNFSGIALIGIGVTWFIYYFTKYKSKAPFWIVSLCFMFFFMASFTEGDLTLSLANPAPRILKIGGYIDDVFYEVKPGLLLNIELLFCFVMLSWFSFILTKYFLECREKNVLPILVSFFLFFVLGTIDILTALNFFTFVYLTEYAYMFIVFSMAYSMTDRFVALHNAITDLNRNLEVKVYQRTMELETAMGDMATMNRELMQTRDALQKANKMLEEQATVDELTSIANRRKFEEFLNLEWRRAMRSSTPISLVLVDVDQFKLYNDTYGHQQGDECLATIAQNLNAMANRCSDIVARYGGEEFVMVLGNTDENAAISVAERSRKRIEDLRLAHEKSAPLGYVTISLGVTTVIPEIHDALPRLIKAADKALYRAKQNGRNRVIFEKC